MKIRIKNIFMITFTMYLFALLSACGGGGGGGNGSQLTGTWEVIEIIEVTQGCIAIGEEIKDTAVIDQTDSDFEITLFNTCSTIGGTISDNSITWSGTILDVSTSIDIDFSGTVSNDGNTITGTTTWRLTDGTCEGTSTVTATRMDLPSSSDLTGTWEGTWQSSVKNTSGIFTADLEQQDSTLSGTIDVTGATIPNPELKGTVIGDNVIFGDIGNKIMFCGTLDNDLKLSGTYANPSIDDRGEWEGEKTQ